MKKYIVSLCMLIAIMFLSACGETREALVADISSESSAEDLTEDTLDSRANEVDNESDIEADLKEKISGEVSENSANDEAAKPEVNPDSKSEDNKNNEATVSKMPENITLKLFINSTQVPVTWESNAAIDEMKEQVKQGDIVVSMSPYGGFEQVGSLGRSYTRNDAQITTSSGDIVLYSGNQIVVFYGSNSWSYTRLGKMGVSSDEAKQLLSGENVSLRITK